MSEHRLRKYVVSEYRPIKNNLTFTPVLLSDSKGRYIKDVLINDRLKVYAKSGKNTTDIVTWCNKNVHKLTHQYGRVHIYVWIGTCDFTNKDGVFITRNKDDRLTTVKDNLRTIKSRFLSANVKLTFLHIPYYSIQYWNGFKGHKNTDIFKEDDNKLNELVDSVNHYIDGLNQELGTSNSPKFNLDLVRSRKPKDSSQRYSLNLKLLKDGIHPGTLLSKAWLVSLTKLINTDCD